MGLQRVPTVASVYVAAALRDTGLSAPERRTYTGVVKMNGRYWNLGCYFCSESCHHRPRVGGEMIGRYRLTTTAFVPTDPVSVERMIEG
jgi:hypothetical protein